MATSHPITSDTHTFTAHEWLAYPPMQPITRTLTRTGTFASVVFAERERLDTHPDSNRDFIVDSILHGDDNTAHATIVGTVNRGANGTVEYYCTITATPKNLG